MGWPQYIYLGLLLLGAGISMEKHGTPKTGTNNFFTEGVISALVVWLLWAGGFFGGNC